MQGTNIEKLKKTSFVEKFLKIIFVFFLVCASMGEWKEINGVLGGIPKVICLGIIFTAFAYGFISPNIKKLKELFPPTAMYFALIALLLLWSVAIWIMNFTDISSMFRGASKMIYQIISVLTAISAVYILGFEAINLYTLGLCITNGLIMLLEIPNYGISESINSLINCIVKFGDAVGFARALEIHDLTFVFGQLMIYYAVFAPKKERKDRKIRRNYLIATTFFFIVGMKRIAIPAVLLFILISTIWKNRKKSASFFAILGVFVTGCFLLFIYGVRSGAVSKICADFGINMMGRDYLWQLAGSYYRFSPTYMGRGFEFVDKIVVEWYQSGIINHAYPLHNDILKVFIELGFPGFLIWSGMQYIIYPIFFLKYADSKTAVLYLSELGYMTVTYMTDNTAFYFWSTMTLKLLVLAYAFYRNDLKKKEEENWKPPTKSEMIALVENMMLEE